MNVAVQPPNRPSRPHKPRPRTRVDNAFLPAALEILETPASPIRGALIIFICTLAVAALAWSYLGTFDIVSTAQGKIQPTGRVKVIQSIELGKTVNLALMNGTMVRHGDILVQLDDTEVRSEEQAIATNLHASRAEITRRQAVLVAVDVWQKQGIWDLEALPLRLVHFSSDTPNYMRQREQLSYEADLNQLQAAILSLAAQRRQHQAAIERLTAMIVAQKALVGTMADRVAMRSTLVGVNAGTKSGVIDAIELRQKEEANLAEQLGQLAEANATLAVATQEANTTITTFIADNVHKETEASRQADELDQQLVKATKRRKSMTIASPIDGTVQTSAITTVGQVVSAGSELMRIVPDDTDLEIEAYLPNGEIGFVSLGEEAVIKIEAFPFTRYGVVSGRVTHISNDAIPEPDARQLEGEPAKQLQSLIPFGNAQRVQNLVFPVTIKPDVEAINIDGVVQPLSPGMAVTVEIKTGKRRILEYLFSPIAQIASEAMQER